MKTPSLHYTRNSGMVWKRAGGGQGLSALFDLNGRDIWYGSYEGGAKLARRQEYAIAMFQRSVYLSKNGGQSWQQIAARGQGQ